MRITSIVIATLLLQSVQFSSAKLRATPLGTKRQARKSNNSSSRRTRTQTQKGKSKKSNNGEDYLLGVQRKDHQRQDFGDDEPLEAATATTPPTVPSLERCSCSPIEYNFVLSLDQDCGNNQLEGSPGIDLTFCLLSTHETERSGKQGNKGRGGRQLHKTAVKKEERIKIDFDDKVTLVDKRQLDGGDIEIVSIQFLEFDTSGKLIVLNQDDTYANTSLTNGDIATFKSISSDLDPTLPIEDQLDLLPGGVQVTLRGKVTDVATGEENIVSNRITWSYTNGCDVEPLSEGMGIGWTTIGELTLASNAFCPAAEFRTEAPTIASLTASPTTAPVTAAPSNVPSNGPSNVPTGTPVVTTASPTPPPVEMCEFCLNGLDDPGLLLPTEDGATCGTAKDFAATITADNDFCATVKLAESLCCPPKPDTPSPTEKTTPSPSMPPVTVSTEAPPESTEAPPETTPVPSETTEAPSVTTEAPLETTEAPPVTTEATPASTEVPPPATTESPPMSMPIFAGKSKAAKACSSADGVSKSSKCASSKSKTKKTHAKTKTYKTVALQDPMSKAVKESSKGGKGVADSKSGKTLVVMDAKAEKATKAAKSAKAGSSKSGKKGNSKSGKGEKMEGSWASKMAKDDGIAGSTDGKANEDVIESS